MVSKGRSAPVSIQQYHITAAARIQPYFLQTEEKCTLKLDKPPPEQYTHLIPDFDKEADSMDTIGSKIATLVLMIAVLGYTAYNYSNGKTDFPVLCIMAFLLLTTGTRIFLSLIEDFKNKK